MVSVVAWWKNKCTLEYNVIFSLYMCDSDISSAISSVFYLFLRIVLRFSFSDLVRTFRPNWCMRHMCMKKPRLCFIRFVFVVFFFITIFRKFRMILCFYAHNEYKMYSSQIPIVCRRFSFFFSFSLYLFSQIIVSAFEFLARFIRTTHTNRYQPIQMMEL